MSWPRHAQEKKRIIVKKSVIIVKNNYRYYMLYERSIPIIIMMLSERSMKLCGDCGFCFKIRLMCGFAPMKGEGFSHVMLVCQYQACVNL